MLILIDTQIFLWYISGDKKLKARYINIISDYNNEVFLSVASVWECIIKNQIGKLNLPNNPFKYLSEQRTHHNIKSFSIEENIFQKLHELPLLHKDPFDRIIISQSTTNNMDLISEDEKMKYYVPFGLKLVE